MILNHKSKGSGFQQIVFVHGNSQSLEYWDNTVQILAKTGKYKFIAVDLPGHGKSFRSQNAHEDYTLPELGKYLKNFLENNIRGAYILVVNSLGANITGEMIGKAGDCRGIMLVGPTAVGMGLGMGDIIKDNPNVATAFTAHPTPEQLDLLIGDCAYGLSEPMKLYVKNVFNSTDPMVRQVLSVDAGNPLNDELQNIASLNLPVAVVFGEEERLCHTGAFDKIEFLKWRDHVFLIPESGHCCQLDQPARLCELIADFAADCFK